MFAVPGWAVSASSLVQEKAGSKSERSSTGANGGLSARKPKKRKRNEEADDIGLVYKPLEHTAHRKVSPSSSKETRETTDSSRDLGKVGVQGEHGANSTLRERNRSTQSHPEENDDRSHSETTKGEAKTKPKPYTEKPGIRHQNGSRGTAGPGPTDSIKHNAAIPPAPSTNLTPLQAKMRSKLTSARFRHLNETLYTTTSSEALQLFTSSPELFADYHAGFAQQVKESWPQNPVEQYVKSIKMRGAVSEQTRGVQPLPRRKTGSCTIADLGCGDAPLARGSQSVIRTLKLKFHNYDLHAANTFVTKADMSNLPLRDGEADVAVFCLSLMGTNWISFVEEAWRILRGDGKGEIWVAEVKSRFGRVTKGRVVENSVGKRRKPQKPRRSDENDEYDGPEQFAEDARNANETHDETDISAFVKVFTRRGFQLKEGSVQKANKMFVSMVFTKTGIPTAGKHKGLRWTGKGYQKHQESKPRFVGGQKNEDEITLEEEAKALKPCVYKTR